ncbi:hypothetical protein L3Q82_025365 [Scortum barcoo]|uniref:Uncharacterized protein n=1 Tax=Scortum barcoo TaxID=214431 RepID=A0ACB8WSI1_9TELE|nr:hypothetical protein L3Q82_025365 [Scortum barcoo]
MDALQFAYQPNTSVDDALIYMLHRTYTHLDTPDASTAVCASAELRFRYHPEQHIGTGAPQGTVLAPFLYTIYTVDFQHNTSNCFLQKNADDTAVVSLIRGDEEEEYRKTIEEFVNWSEHNHLILNTTKTKEVIVDFRKRRRRRDQPTPISIRGTEVEVAELPGQVTWTGQTKSGSQAHHEKKNIKDRYVARIGVTRGPTLEPGLGLGLGLAGERLAWPGLPLPTGPGRAQPEMATWARLPVGSPPCRKVHEGPVQCGFG